MDASGYMVKSFKSEVLEHLMHKLVGAIWDNRMAIDTNRMIAIIGVVVGGLILILGCLNTWVMIGSMRESGSGGRKVASDLVLQNMQASVTGGVQYVDNNKGCQRD